MSRQPDEPSNLATRYSVSDTSWIKMLGLPLPSNDHTHEEYSGQSLVELALTLPLLLLILFGVLDLGRLFYAYVTLTNSAREGARIGTSNPANVNNAIKIGVEQEAANVLNLTDSNIVIDCAAYSDTPPYAYNAANCSSTTAGDRIRVTVNYNFEFVTLSILGLKNLTLSNYTSMAIVKPG